MKKNKKLSKIVYLIPTYNEKDNILLMLKLVYKTLTKLKKYNSTILVVDDNSPDGTGNVVRGFIRNHKNTVLLTGKKEGLGKAMIRGYNYSIKKLSADIIISNEADFSYDPKKSNFMIKKIEEGYDVVLGSRKVGGANKWPQSRKIIHFVANTVFANFIAGINEIEDHNSAFKAIKVKGVLDKFDFTTFPRGFSFFNYLTFRISAITPSIKIFEFKTTFRPRTKGVSKMMMKDAIEYMNNCFKIRYERTFNK